MPLSLLDGMPRCEPAEDFVIFIKLYIEIPEKRTDQVVLDEQGRGDSGCFVRLVQRWQKCNSL